MKKMFTHFKLVALFAGLVFMTPFSAVAQDSDCGTQFFDTGGPTGTYGANEDYTVTFCPDVDGDVVTVTFTSFNVEANWHKLYVFDGPSTSSPQISSGNGAGSGPCDLEGGFWGNTIPGPFTSTDPSGCLTFRFCTDGVAGTPGVHDGWAADVSCGAGPDCFAPLIDFEVLPRNCDNLTFGVKVTVTEPGQPAAVPLLLASASVDDVTLPGVGGTFSNTNGAEFTLQGLPLDEEVTVSVNLLATACTRSQSFTVVSNGCPIPLTCGEALEQSYCYANNDTTPFLYVSPNDEPVVILFESGLIQACCDDILIYDGTDATGTLLFSGNNGGDLAGVSAVANSGSLFMQLDTDAFTACATNSINTSEWNWIVGCDLDIEGCTDPDAVNFLPVANIDDGSCIFGGDVCTNSIEVGSDDLPYNLISNTSLFGDNYAAADVPAQTPGTTGTGTYSTFYLNGNDVIFEFSSDDDTFIDISVVNTGTWAGLWVFEGCPFTNTLTWHTGSDANGRFANAVPVQGGTPVYIVVSTWPAPQTTPFNITIEETEFDCPDLNANIGSLCDFNGSPGLVDANCVCEELVGTDCTNPFVVEQSELPFTQSSNTANFFDTYSSADLPPQAPGSTGTGGYSGLYLNGDDVAYEFTPDEDTFIDIAVTGTGTWVGLWVFTDCPFTSGVAWHTGSDSNGRFVDALPVNAGTTYYIIISTWPAPQNTAYTLNISETVFDCPELNANIGSACDTDDGFGLLDDDCECAEIEFDGCLNGDAFGTQNPTCDDPIASTTGAWVQEYTTVTVINGVDYNFTTTPPTNPDIPVFFITISDEDGNTVLAAGVESVNWTASFNGAVRFYVHASATCTDGPTGGVTSHAKTTTILDCSGQVFDCPDLGQNIGTACTTDDGFGLISEDCVCDVIEFDGCLDGSSFGTQNPTCDNPVATTTGAWVQEYTNVTVLNGVEYSFTTSAPTNPEIPVFYITIGDETGTTVLAAGVESLTWTSTLNGVVRFYVHGSPTCTDGPTGTVTSHTKTTTILDCSGQIFDCPDLSANIGDDCDDGNPESLNDIVTEDCECVGIIPGPGSACPNPIEIAGLPYLTTDHTQNYLNFYGTADVPGTAAGAITNGTGSTSYLTGDEAVYEFTASDDINIDVSLSGTTNGWVALWVFTGCPFTSTVGYHTATTGDTRLIPELPVTAGTTYYIVVTSWLTQLENTPYTLLVKESGTVDCPELEANIGDPCDDGNPASINEVITPDCECVGFIPPTGDACVDPLLVPELPFNDSGNTADYTNVYGASDRPANAPNVIGIGTGTGSYLTGNDVVYAYTPMENQLINVELSNHDGWVGLWVFSGCPFASTLAYHTASTSTGRLIEDLQVNAGSTYYVVISTWPAPQTTPYTLDITVSETLVDCPEFSANIGESCDDGDPNTINGVLNEECECISQPLPIANCGEYSSAPGLPFGINPASFPLDIVTDEIEVSGITEPVLDLQVAVKIQHTAMAEVAVKLISPTGVEVQLVSNICGAGDDMHVLFDDAAGPLSCTQGQVPVLLGTFSPVGDLSSVLDEDINGTWTLEVSDNFVFVEGGVFEEWCLIPVFEDEPALPSIFEIVEDSDIHNTLEAALLAAELDGLLSTEGPFTLFAPTDDAFDALEDGVLDALLADPFGLLTDILSYHLVDGIAMSNELSDGQVINTVLPGTTVTVSISAEGVFINDAQVILADLEASNGVVHVIDAVLIPEEPSTGACEDATAIVPAPTFAESELFVSNAGVAPSGDEQCLNNDNQQADQWFSFESIATVMYFRAWGLGDYDAAVEIYESCGGEPIICQNNAPVGDREIVIIQNTTVGETYYARVYHGGAGTPSTLDYSVAAAHIPFTKLREEDCGVFDYTPADIIRTELPPNQFLLTNWYFEFTENEAPFNTYEILSPNGSNPNFKLQWFSQAEYGRTYSVRTRPRMYQGPNWGDYSEACDIGFSATPLTTQLKESMALGFYNMCDILEADNVPGATQYRWRILDGFEVLTHTTNSRFLPLKDVSGLNLGSPYAIRVRAKSLGQWSPLGEIRLFAMNNFVPETGVDANITPCGATYSINQVLSAVEICAAEFYTWRFTNLSDPLQADLFYTRDDGLRTISLNWVTGLTPGDTYAVQVLGGSGGLVGEYGFSCEITIAGAQSLVDMTSSEGIATNEADINLYPNPIMGGEVMVSVSNLEDDQNDIIIEVFDMYGKKVHSENFANNGRMMNVALNFHQPMAAGIYTVNILSNKELIGARKLVVQK